MTLALIEPGTRIAPPAVLHQLVQERTLLRVFNDHYLTTPLPDIPKVRAHIAGEFLPRGAVVALDCAVWIYCGGLVPERMSVLLPRTASLPARSKNIHAIRTRFELTDIAGLATVPITTKERTIVDAARWQEPDHARKQIKKLIQVGADIEQAARLIGASGRNVIKTREVINSLR